MLIRINNIQRKNRIKEINKSNFIYINRNNFKIIHKCQILLKNIKLNLIN